MKNLKIEVPEGYYIDEDRSTFYNIVFKKFETIYNPDKIYLFKGFMRYYKLHNTSIGKFAFISLSDSNCLADGSWDKKDINEAIKINGASEFDSIKDAIEKGFFN